MAASRIEECTIGELSNRVAQSNAREDRAADAQHARLVKETTERILTIVGPRIYGVPFHPWRPGARGCVSCHYAEKHPVHREIPSA